jgi:hypothetical protein
MGSFTNIDTSSGKHVFICYSHRDMDIVAAEVAWLQRQGFKLWYDDNIAAGHAWSEELANAIASASAVLYFLSPDSTSSAYCMDELHFAKDRSRPIIPIEIETMELSPGLHLTLGTRQFIRMSESSRKDFRNKLAAGLSAILTSGGREPESTAVVTPVTAPRAKPAFLRARLAGMSAALISLLLILVIA